MRSSHAVRRGLVAGAAGTLALNAATYLDMLLRGRPASPLPAEAARRLADRVGFDLAAGGHTVQGANRAEGLGALLGFASGLSLGVVYGLVRAAGWRPSNPVAVAGLTALAMAGANGPASLAGLTDPRDWGVEGWLEDLVPHVAFAVATTSVHDRVR